MAMSKEVRAGRAGDALTYMYETARRLRQDKAYSDADRVEIATDSLTEVLNNNGMTCGCKIEDTSHGHKVICNCRPRKAKGKALSGGFFMDGEHCRDGSGAFVPTSACRGPVGRDAGGRFVSLKK